MIAITDFYFLHGNIIIFMQNPKLADFFYINLVNIESLSTLGRNYSHPGGHCEVKGQVSANVQ